MIAFCVCEGVGSPKVHKPPKVCVIRGGGPCGVFPWMGICEFDFFECMTVFVEGAEVVLVGAGVVVDVRKSILG